MEGDVRIRNPFPKAAWYAEKPWTPGEYILIKTPRCADAYYGPIPKASDLRTALETAEDFCRRMILPYESDATFEIFINH